MDKRTIKIMLFCKLLGIVQNLSNINSFSTSESKKHFKNM